MQKEERIEKERLAFQRKLKEADKEAASDEQRQEALQGYLKKDNKYKVAHDKDTKDNIQPLKGAIDNIIKGANNG